MAYPPGRALRLPPAPKLPVPLPVRKPSRPPGGPRRGGPPGPPLRCSPFVPTPPVAFRSFSRDSLPRQPRLSDTPRPSRAPRRLRDLSRTSLELLFALLPPAVLLFSGHSPSVAATSLPEPGTFFFFFEEVSNAPWKKQWKTIKFEAKEKKKNPSIQLRQCSRSGCQRPANNNTQCDVTTTLRHVICVNKENMRIQRTTGSVSSKNITARSKS